MKKYSTLIPILATLLLPAAASAHQHATFDINGTQYDFVIGSLNEPVVVDDKTGVDLRVTSGGRMQKAEDGDMEPVGGTPTTGLENDLKVELIAGDMKKTLELSPVFNTPGSYKAPFYPTVATTLSYRFFGTLNNTPVDLTFTCRAEGATAAEEGEKQVSNGVKQILKGGGFGCPLEKTNLGFPEQSESVIELSKSSHSTPPVTWVALALSAIAFGVALRRKS